MIHMDAGLAPLPPRLKQRWKQEKHCAVRSSFSHHRQATTTTSSVVVVRLELGLV
jgi:hypothetical protein